MIMQNSDIPQTTPNERIIYLVRHGEFKDAALGRCIGRMDIPLSETGHKEAHQAGRWLAEKVSFFSLWSSPLSRCVETADAIQEETGCAPAQIENDLAEMAAGAWEGMTFAEIQEKYPREYEERGNNLIHYQTPDGESFFDAGNRFLGGLQKILIAEDRASIPLVIVAHSGVIRSSLCHLGAWSFDYMLCIPQPNAGITILRAKKSRDRTWQLIPTEAIGIPTN